MALNEKLEEIGEWCFHGTAIKEITIPKTVTKLKKFTFFGCRNLTEVKLNEGL